MSSAGGSHTPKSGKHADPYKRHSTKHRGITYRKRRDGSRAYSVYFEGSYISVEGGEREAVTAQAELRREKAMQKKPMVLRRVRFRDLAEEWWKRKEGGLRRRTRTYYRSALDLVLLPRLGDLYVHQIDADTISSLVHDLELKGLHAIDPNRPLRPLGFSSIDNYEKPLRGILSLAARRSLIQTNPFDHLLPEDRPQREDRKQPHEWSPGDVDRLVDAARQLARIKTARYDYSSLIRVAVTLGLRLGEVLGLQWGDLDRREGVIYVRRQWLTTREYGPPKTRAGNRRIPLPSDLRDELIALRLRSRYSSDDDPIFASQRGTPLGHRNVTQRGFEPAAAKAGLDVTFHELRDAAASRLINAGLDPVTVAAILGHEDSSVTLRIYAHIWDRSKTDASVRQALSGAVGAATHQSTHQSADDDGEEVAELS